MGYEEIYTRETNTAMILSAGHSIYFFPGVHVNVHFVA